MSRKLTAAILVLALAVPAGAIAQTSQRPGLNRVVAPPPPATSRVATQAPSSSVNFSAPAPTDTGYYNQNTIDRSKRQSNGEYLPIDRTSGMSLGNTQDAWTQPFENMSPGQVAPGVVRFQWSPELVMPVRAREFMITTFVFPEWEKIERVLIGESYYFEGSIIRDNAVVLRSSASGIDTSISVFGESGNSYDFYVRAESFNTTTLTDMKVFVDAAPPKTNEVSWFKQTNERRQAAGNAPGAATGGTNPNYADVPPPPQAPVTHSVKENSGVTDETPIVSGSKWYIPDSEVIIAHRMFEVNEGDREIAPEVVYSNGRWTFFNYGKMGVTVDRPIVYRLVDGIETRVNTRTIGDFNEVLVAEAVGDFVLRNGQKVVCVIRASQITEEQK